MKRLVTFLLLAAATALFMPPVASAAVIASVPGAHVAEWLTKDPIDWAQGGTFAALGMVGALVTLFGLVGGSVPGTTGQAGIDAAAERLETRERKLDDLLKSDHPDLDEITSVQNSINDLRNYVRKERRYQFLLAAVLYAILGAAIAALLAQDILQAIVIGAGWTGFVGALGLRRDRDARETARNLELTTVAANLANFRTNGTIPPKVLDDMGRRVEVAQKI
jgi:opacity protein-like surface antigen